MPKRSLLHRVKSPTHHLAGTSAERFDANGDAETGRSPGSGSSSFTAFPRLSLSGISAGLPLQWRDRSGVDRIPYYVFRHLFPTIFRCRYYLIPSLRLCQEYIYSDPKLYLYYIDIHSYLILSGSKTNSTENQNRSQCFGHSYFISHDKVSGKDSHQREYVAEHSSYGRTYYLYSSVPKEI